MPCRHCNWSLLLLNQACSIGPNKPCPVQPRVSRLDWKARSQPHSHSAS